jgi:hypothetical protein
LVEIPEILNVIEWGAHPLAFPLLPNCREGSCPQLFEIEKRQNRKKEILIIWFIAGSFNPKKKSILRPANVE